MHLQYAICEVDLESRERGVDVVEVLVLEALRSS